MTKYNALILWLGLNNKIKQIEEDINSYSKKSADILYYEVMDTDKEKTVILYAKKRAELDDKQRHLKRWAMNIEKEYKLFD